MKLTDLPNLSSKRADALQKSGISTPEDLLMLFPHRYIDRTRVQAISELSGTGESVTVTGTVKKMEVAGFGRKRRLIVSIEHNHSILTGVWFRGISWLQGMLNPGDRVAFFGTVKRYGNRFSMAHPDVETLKNEGDTEELSRIVPVYPANKEFARAKITHKLIHSWIRIILTESNPSEFLPESICSSLGLPKRRDAFEMIHNPQNLKETGTALDRFKFEELFLFELSMARIRHRFVEKKQGPEMKEPGSYTHRFFNEILPFTLTDGQKQTLREIRQDLFTGPRMHRLIQGDVGSGKTVVAIGALLMAIDNGYQTAFMAPTEILAEQHYHTLASFLGDMDIEIRLLTGGQNRKLRQDLLTSIEGGQCQIVVGTHAIIQESVRFHNLGLAVIDEQHRFGVKQRASLFERDGNPHLLVMSATPIPRSLAMTLYSDLDISVMAGLPAGRRPVKTALRTDRKREEIYRFLEQNCSEGGQAYVIYPLIEESEVMDLKDATMGFEKLKKRFPGLEISLIHGRLKREEKEEIMQRFHAGEIQILVSTTVVEVGVDVPNANVMIIEQAERFGLSQLHQLRGRIGRGSRESYCILMPGEKPGKAARFRLRKMVETQDGFEIAEADLKLRGPGDFLGTKQSGLPDFRYADIVEDQWILAQAKEKAWQINDKDPDLKLPGHKQLRTVFEPYFKERSEYYGLG
ncbi:MAG: ATP-dependent DNA helicase RecG [Balneolaceae bacterium]